jgi:Uma2 family endonuclease
MASPSASLALESRGRLFTAADLAVMPTHLPSGDVDFELDKGRFRLMVPPGQVHSEIQNFLSAALFNQGRQPGHGRAFTEVGIVLSRFPDTVVGADAAFVTSARCPVRRSPEGYLETIPDLVIEIRTRNDSIPEMQAKASVYLDAGVRVVWIVDPMTKTVAAHRPGSDPQVRNEADTLRIDEVIPGFRLSVAEIFSVTD